MSIPYSEVARFSRDLGGLLELGYSLEEAVDKAREFQSPDLKAIGQDTVTGLQKGETLSQALQPHQTKFPLFYRLVASAEAGEALKDGLLRASVILEDLADRRKVCFLATLYPALIFTFAVLGGYFLITFCGGLFQDLFASMNLSLPLPTRIFLALSNLASNPIGFLLFLAPLILLWSLVLGKIPTSTVLYKVPIFGRWLLHQESVMFLGTMGQLLEQGTSLTEASELASTVCAPPVQKRLAALPERLKAGDSLSEGLAASKVIPELGVWAVQQRELAGSLKLTEVSKLLQRELDCTTHTGIILFEPLIFLMVFFGICCFVASIFVPLYQLIGNLG